MGAVGVAAADVAVTGAGTGAELVGAVSVCAIGTVAESVGAATGTFEFADVLDAAAAFLLRSDEAATTPAAMNVAMTIVPAMPRNINRLARSRAAVRAA